MIPLPVVVSRLLVSIGSGPPDSTPCERGFFSSLLGQIQRGTDKTAAELGIRRLREEICHDEQEVARLVREAVETERNQVSWSLAEIGKRSQSGWDRFFNLNASDPARIETMVLALSTAEADRLVVAKYTGSKVRPILLAMVALKRDLEQKRLQLETYRRVVAE